VEACRKVFAVAELRCNVGEDTGDSCLSDAQINGLMTAATPTVFAFPLSHSLTSIGPYPVFAPGDLQGSLYGSTADGVRTVFNMLDDGVIRYFDQQSEASTMDGFNYLAWQARVQHISKMYDATDPDLDAFKAHGGKLILVQGTTDMLVAPSMTTAYVEQVEKRYGPQAKSFERYYMVPGFGHGSGVFGAQWDSLTALDRWVEEGTAPVNPVVTDGNAASKGRTRPLCEYPTWPKYNGGGDVNVASNFKCVSE
jgi:hypothetical protein